MKLERLPTRLALCLACCLLLAGTAGTAGAQSPVDAQLNSAMAALDSAFSACTNTKFLECIVTKKQLLQVTGFLARTVNKLDERTDIKVNLNQTVAAAQNSYKIDADNISKNPVNNVPPVQFWRTETFAAGGNPAVLSAALGYSDRPTGSAAGVLSCGNLTANFSLTLSPNPSNPQEGKPLVDAAHAELKEVMTRVAAALAGGACAGGAPAKPSQKLYPLASPSTYTIKPGDTIHIEGVVWTLENGIVKFPVQAKVEIYESTAAAPVPVNVISDAQGHFDVALQVLDQRSAETVQVAVHAISPDPKLYEDGTRYISVDALLQGDLRLQLTTDKALYALGEPVSVSGLVTAQDGKPVPAQVSIYNEFFGTVPTFSTGADGSFNQSFIPGKEVKRPPDFPLMPGIHRVNVRVESLGYGQANASASYLLAGALDADPCRPVEASVSDVMGRTTVILLDTSNQGNVALGGDSVVSNRTRLTQGLGVQTSDGARVALRLGLTGPNGLTTVDIVLNSGSTLKIGRLCRDAQGNVQVVLSVDKAGQVAVNVSNAAAGSGALNMKIVTPAASVRSVKTQYFINVDDTGATTVAALEGTVLVAGPDDANGIQLPAPAANVVRPGEKPDSAKSAPLNGQIDPALQAMLGAASGRPLPTAPPLGAPGSQPQSVPAASAPFTLGRTNTQVLALGGGLCLVLAALGVGFIVLRGPRKRTMPPTHVPPSPGNMPPPPPYFRPVSSAPPPAPNVSAARPAPPPASWPGTGPRFVQPGESSDVPTFLPGGRPLSGPGPKPPIVTSSSDVPTFLPGGKAIHVPSAATPASAQAEPGFHVPVSSDPPAERPSSVPPPDLPESNPSLRITPTSLPRVGSASSASDAPAAGNPSQGTTPASPAPETSGANAASSSPAPETPGAEAGSSSPAPETPVLPT